MLELASGLRIPFAVTRALEERRLVFFCGAGISAYTGLPLFKELTRELFHRCRVPLHADRRRTADFCESFAFEPDRPQDAAFQKGKYDRALAVLEQQVPRDTVRRELAEVLSTEPASDQQDCALHRDLLDLAALPHGGHRLVTTNFDDRFERAADVAKKRHPAESRRYELANAWQAPRIASPRAESWRSVTYLHGRLTDAHDHGVEDLVLTSADFGRAYLQDGWAARFIVELFRDFTVLFIGYSVDDPVMGYLVDAITLDRASGRPFQRPYALVGWREWEDQKGVQAAWLAKNIEPFFFKVTAEHGHRTLNEGMSEWATLHRQGREGRRALALEILSGPSSGANSDGSDPLETLVWALSEPDGSVARAVADAAERDYDGQHPQIGWLRALRDWSERRFEPRSHADLDAGIGTWGSAAVDSTGTFLVEGHWIGDPLDPPAVPDQPAPATHVRRTPLFGGDDWVPLHPVAHHLGRWITANLHEPELARIIAERGGKISDQLCEMIAQEIDTRVERSNLAGVGQLPRAVEKFWRIVLRAHDQDGVGSGRSYSDLWRPRFDMLGRLDTDSRDQLLQMLAPRIVIKPASSPPGATDQAGDVRLRHLASVEISESRSRSTVDRALQWLRNETHPGLFADLAGDLSEVLVRVLRIAEWIEDDGPIRWHQIGLRSLEKSSNSDHRFRSWEVAVLICRDALAALVDCSSSSADLLLCRWAEYARESWGGLFVRLVLHAGTKARSNFDIALDLLLANVNGALWDGPFAAEVAHFLSEAAPRLGPETLARLQRVLLDGPPAEHRSQSETSEDADARTAADALVDWRLAWLLRGGAELSPGAIDRGRREIERQLEASREAPRTLVATADGARWMPPLEPDALSTMAPEKAAARLADHDSWDAGNAIRNYGKRRPGSAFRVVHLLKSRRPQRAAILLQWVADALTDERLLRYHAAAAARLQAELSFAVEHSSTAGLWGYYAWLQAIARVVPTEGSVDACFWSIWDGAWQAIVEREEMPAEADPVTWALNCDAGRLADVLLARLQQYGLAEDSDFPPEIRQRFDEVIVGAGDAHRAARLILVHRLPWLHRIERGWARANLISRLDAIGDEGGEARDLWMALLPMGPMPPKLWPDLKPALLAALEDPSQFPEHFLRWLGLAFGFAWVRPGYFDEADHEDLDRLFASIDVPLLEAVADSFTDALRHSGGAAAALWRENIDGKIRRYWPLRMAVQTPALSEQLARMLLETHDAFPQAVSRLVAEKRILGPATRISDILYQIAGDASGEFPTAGEGFDYAGRFPRPLLTMLDRLIAPGCTSRTAADMLRRVLTRIKEVDPSTAESDEMKRLDEWLLRG